MKKEILFVCVCAAGALASSSVEKETREAAEAAVERGMVWLAENQKQGGYWSNERFPALSGLPLWALSVSGGEKHYAKKMDAAVRFIMGKAQKDGGIYVPDPRRGGAGLGNYNTSVCMMALRATGRKDVIPVILRARDYTAATQLTGEDAHTGGYGYDRGGRRHSDLSNTSMALDAMRMTEDAEELRPAGEKRAELNWDAALKYVSGMQQQEGQDKGGFLYTKSFAPALGTDARGMIKKRGMTGRPILQAYGSITYDGLLSLIHCNLTRGDPRVVSALDFCVRHWTLDENPGQGAQGIYFYYDILARALSASGVDEIQLATGEKLAWRDALIRKVLSLQRDDGSWVNENNRWWENDPVLATSYSLIALSHAMKKTK